jgi:predicted phosphoribosyltransferase
MGTITDNPALRDCVTIFADRHDAGRQLGSFLMRCPGIRKPVVCAIPAGGVPVGVEIARALSAPLVPVIVRKIRIPGTTETGFGAVAWDGQMVFNDRLASVLGLSPAQVRAAVEETQQNVRKRVDRYTGGCPFPDLAGKCIVLTDDGLASGYTMLVAIRALRPHNPAKVLVAVPTASEVAARLVAANVDELVCLNVRGGSRFAVAEAYRHWYDLDDREVMGELASVRQTDL